MILVIRPSGDIINMTAPYHTSFSHASSCRCRLDSFDRLLLISCCSYSPHFIRFVTLLHPGRTTLSPHVMNEGATP
jgi:hypothetical protein